MGAVTTKVSSFGRINSTFYSLLNFLDKECGKNLEVCDFGCLDGIHTIPFLKKGYKVDAFDMNEVYLYGGHVILPIVEKNNIIEQRRTILGAEDRINIEKLHDNVNLYNENFFEFQNKKYDLVYSKRGLSRKEYSNISMEQKIEGLKNAVKDGGIIYLEYLMWNDDKNNENLNVNQYLKQCQMKEYFKDGWKILSLVEDRKNIIENPHIENPNYHKHRIGTIKAQKLEGQKKEYYKINIKV